MLRVVLDTNVFISALLVDGTSREILNLARQQEITLVASPSILSETAKKLREKFKWPEHNIKKFLRQTSHLAELTNPKKSLKVIKADETDNRILECAVSGKANLILSGDKHLLKLKEYQNIPIMKPSYLKYLMGKEK